MLTTFALVKSYGNLNDEIKEPMLVPFMNQASYEVQTLFSDYADVETELSGSAPTQRSIDIQLGETYLALAYSIIPLNTRASVEGGFIQSIGFSDSETRLLTQTEANKLYSHYKSMAYGKLSAYIDASVEEPDKVNGPMGWFIV